MDFGDLKKQMNPNYVSPVKDPDFNSDYLNTLKSVLNNTIGDKPQDPNDADSIRTASSPVDFLPVNELGSAVTSGAKALVTGVADSAPRLLGNEIGSIGADVTANALPMDQASRMARAQQMGMSPDTWYHGTAADIKGFDPTKSATTQGSFFTKSPRFASDAATEYDVGTPEGYSYKEGANVVPVKLNTSNLFDPDNSQHISDLQNYLNTAGSDKFKGTSNYAKIPDLNKINDPDSGWINSEMPVINNYLKDKNYSGQYVYEGGQKNIQMMDPSKIRSVNAAFDPSKKNSENILAGLGLATAAGSQFGDDNDDDQDQKFQNLRSKLGK